MIFENLEQVKEDLSERCPDQYFEYELFEEDPTVFKRRSFGDLMKFYNVSEEMLMRALVEEGFIGKVCREIKKAVFYKYYAPGNKFWGMFGGNFGEKKDIKDEYTAERLEDIYDRAMKMQF